MYFNIFHGFLFYQRAGVSKNASLISKKSSAGFVPWRTAARVGKNRYSKTQRLPFFCSEKVKRLWD